MFLRERRKQHAPIVGGIINSIVMLFFSFLFWQLAIYVGAEIGAHVVELACNVCGASFLSIAVWVLALPLMEHCKARWARAIIVVGAIAMTLVVWAHWLSSILHGIVRVGLVSTVIVAMMIALVASYAITTGKKVRPQR